MIVKKKELELVKVIIFYLINGYNHYLKLNNLLIISLYLLFILEK